MNERNGRNAAVEIFVREYSLMNEECLHLAARPTFTCVTGRLVISRFHSAYFAFSNFQKNAILVTDRHVMVNNFTLLCDLKLGLKFCKAVAHSPSEQ